MEPKQESAQGAAQGEREQDSLAPFQLDRLTIEEEVAGMNRGKGLKLLGVLTLAGVLMVGGAMAVKRIDHEEQISQAGAAVLELRRSHLDAYLQCVLPSVRVSTLGSGERLHSAIEAFTERLQKSYARTLQSCEPKLAALGPALAVLPAPGELAPAIDQLRKTATGTHAAASALREYLADPGTSYDYVVVTVLIDRLARASLAYREREAGLKQLLDGQ